MAAIANTITDTVTTSRTLDNRSPAVTIDDVLHVATRDSGTWDDITTHCGLVSPANTHGSIKHQPLTEVGCATCRNAQLLVPFEHRITLGRKQAGKSPIRGGGVHYATTWRCTCDAEGRVNTAPSRGGRRAAEQEARQHLAAVAANTTA